MSGYDALRAMRKGSDPDPDLEAWKKDINPYPRADPENDNQWQMRINATKGDLGYGKEDENGEWVPDGDSIYPHMKQLKEEGGEENEDEYRECVERGSTYTLYEDEPDLYYAATPTPIKPTTQTAIDAHAAGGDNVWQRGQTARQQAAMARDAQQARDLARPYRMAPKVAYKQAQEEQNMEPTEAAKKSAMPELPSIGEMIKGKRENPRENLAEFQKGLISSLRRPKDPIWSDDIGQNLELARRYPPNKLWNAYIGGGQLRSDTESWNARNAPNDEVWAYMMQAVQPEQRQDALKYRGNQPAPTTMQVPKYSDPQGGWVSKEQVTVPAKQVPKYSDPQGGWVSKEQVTVPDYSKKESSEEEEKN